MAERTRLERAALRFGALSATSVAHRSRLLLEFAVPAQVLVSILCLLLAQRTGIVDRRRATVDLAIGILVLLICLSAAGAAERRLAEGRWTAYLSVVMFGGWEASVAIGFGGASSPLVGWGALTVVLVGVWFDERVGLVAAAYALVGLAVGSWLVLTHQIPYAFLLTTDSLQAEGRPAFVATMLVAFVGIAAFALVLTLLATVSRRLQGEQLRVMQSLAARYAPVQIARQITDGSYTESVAPRRARLTIVFSDIVGFTEASDQLDAEDLAAVLDEYLSEMSAIAHQHDGTVEQFVGDAIMVFFGAPIATTDTDHALRAVHMSLAMQARLAELENVWLRRGIRKPFRARIGINTGHVSVGDFGSEDRKVYSAIGIQVNIAARIQAHCPPGSVLIADTTWALVRDQISCVPFDELELKGVHYRVPVYQVAPA